MKLTKSAITLFCICLGSAGLAAQGASVNLLANPGLERLAASGIPELWRTDEWNPGNTEFRAGDRDPNEGSRYFTISSADEDDAKLVQTVKVKPKSLYRFSAMIRASGLKADRKGAYISVLNIMDGSPEVHETNGAWQEVSFYGRTGKSQKSVDFCLRLGGYSNLASGKADFDRLAMEKVDKLPAGAAAVLLEAPAQKAKPTQIPSSDPLVIFMSLLGLCFLIYFLDKPKSALSVDSSARAGILLWAVIAAGLALRLPFCFGGHGYVVDVNNFKSWAHQAVNSRIAFFYRDASFADYPPGYVYVLAIIGGIRALFSLGNDSPIFEFLIRLPAVACDFGIGYALYRFVGKRSGLSRGLLACALFLLNPLTIQDSAIWGQVDSTFTLALLLSLWALSDKRFARAGALYGLAALLKPQAFIFAPVFLCALIGGRKLKDALRAVLGGLGAMAAGFLPFLFVHGPLFPFKLYTDTLASYPYATLNAANLWGALGLNMESLTRQFLGLSIGGWGNIALALVACSSFLFYFLMRKKDSSGREPIFETACFLIFAVFAFSVKMHERYLFPFFPLLLCAWAYRSSLRLPLLGAALSLVGFMNVSFVYRISLGKTYHIPANDPLFIVCSILDLAGFISFIPCILPEGAFDRKGRESGGPSWISRRIAEPLGFDLLGQKAESANARLDGMILAGLCLACLALGLAALGDLKAPSTGWKPSSQSEVAVLDLGSVSKIGSFSWYSGIGDGEFTARFSSDAKEWSVGTDFKPNLYAWKNQACGLSARYAEIRPKSLGGNLLELAFWKDGNAQTLPVSASAGAEALVDEQSLAKANAGYMDSMYFDEIYHGRTAYEHLHALEPYEWTHPPLGKLIIALGIKLFGMSPFGWRIMGALFGVMLVPLVYALARMAFPRGRFALGAAALYSLDFMRYTQTRIGTVDVYVVFFVVASSVFMYKYYLSAMPEEGRKPDYISLGLSGLFFGLGAATKWNAIYTGAGLAISFFAAFIRRIGHDLRQSGRRPSSVAWRAVGVISYCALCFILLPLAIYVAAYIPTLYVPGHDWGSIWRYQGQMYNYHTKLVAEHSFSSPWWQWPIMYKPVWYFKADGLKPALASTITALGNPIIWWPSLASAVAAAFIAMRRRDARFLPIVLGFFAQYIPWVLVPRLTFLYHYFPAIPFSLLCTLYCLRALMPGATMGLAWAKGGSGKKEPKKKACAQGSGTWDGAVAFLADNWLWVYVALALVLFIWFLPALSGVTVPSGWIRGLRWFPSWYF